jgi:hypothetical protein
MMIDGVSNIRLVDHESDDKNRTDRGVDSGRLRVTGIHERTFECVTYSSFMWKGVIYVLKVGCVLLPES